MRDKAIDSYLLALKFVLEWFVTSIMIKKLDTAAFSDDYIVFGDLDVHFVTFFINDIGINSISFDNINLDDDNFDCFDLETSNHVRSMVWLINKNNTNHLKNMDEELIPVA